MECDELRRMADEVAGLMAERFGAPPRAARSGSALEAALFFHGARLSPRLRRHARRLAKAERRCRAADTVAADALAAGPHAAGALAAGASAANTPAEKARIAKTRAAGTLAVGRAAAGTLTAGRTRQLVRAHEALTAHLRRRRQLHMPGRAVRLAATLLLGLMLLAAAVLWLQVSRGQR